MCPVSFYNYCDIVILPVCFIIGLLSAGAMGLWHGVEYFEKEKQVGEEFYQQWSTVSVIAF